MSTHPLIFLAFSLSQFLLFVSLYLVYTFWGVWHLLHTCENTPAAVLALSVKSGLLQAFEQQAC